MATARLTERRVDALKPRKSAHDVRDRDLKGFGIRVLPSGAKRSFIHSRHDGRRAWKLVGQAGVVGENEARDRARAMLAAIRNGNDDEAATHSATALETVADEVFRRYARNWKPSTLRVDRYCYRCHILPWFEGRPIANITAHEVRCWFASLHNTPVSADRSAPILSVIMRQAEVYGYRLRGTNPCAGIKRHRRRGRQRFMSTAEIRRLGAVLARHEVDQPQAATIIRLLLLTGCRKDEIVTLKWRFYREGNLFLPDSKNGPRTVWLSSNARAILDGLPPKSVWMSPSTRTNSSMTAVAVDQLRYRVRAEADLHEVRIHDLRQSFAGHAVLRGIPLAVVSRQPQHKRPSMTLRYAHVEDRETKAVAERIGVAIVGALDWQRRHRERPLALLASKLEETLGHSLLE